MANVANEVAENVLTSKWWLSLKMKSKNMRKYNVYIEINISKRISQWKSKQTEVRRKKSENEYV